MKAIRIMSILTMLCAIFSCKAQNKGFESVSADAYEKIMPTQLWYDLTCARLKSSLRDISRTLLI